MIFLDFEKPIAELSEQLEKLNSGTEKGGQDGSIAIRELEEKISEKRKEIYATLTPWQRVQVSRHPDRPYTLSYINALTDGNFIEIFGDRTVKDDKAMVGGLGSIDGKTGKSQPNRIFKHFFIGARQNTRMP